MSYNLIKLYNTNPKLLYKLTGIDKNDVEIFNYNGADYLKFNSLHGYNLTHIINKYLPNLYIDENLFPIKHIHESRNIAVFIDANALASIDNINVLKQYTFKSIATVIRHEVNQYLLHNVLQTSDLNIKKTIGIERKLTSVIHFFDHRTLKLNAILHEKNSFRSIIYMYIPYLFMCLYCIVGYTTLTVINYVIWNFAFNYWLIYCVVILYLMNLLSNSPNSKLDKYFPILGICLIPNYYSLLFVLLTFILYICTYIRYWNNYLIIYNNND